jgi:transcriptional regulator with XRE-family HTH domain
MLYQAKMLDLAKKALGVESDNGLAKLWGLTSAHISQYRTGKNRFDAYAINRISEALDKDPRELTAMIELSRNPHGERRTFWETILKKFAGAASVGIYTALCIGTSTGTDDNGTQTCPRTVDLAINYAQLRRVIRKLKAVLQGAVTYPSPT